MESYDFGGEQADGDTVAGKRKDLMPDLGSVALVPLSLLSKNTPIV